MPHRPYQPELFDILVETMRKLESSADPTDPAIIHLKQRIAIALADLTEPGTELADIRPMAAD